MKARMLLVLSLVAGVVTGAAARADHASAWVLEGSRTMSAEFTVAEGSESFSEGGSLRLTGSDGSYLGAMVESLDHAGNVGLVLRIAGRRIHQPAPLPRGRYRLTLLTDAPARVELTAVYDQGAVLQGRPAQARFIFGEHTIPAGSATGMYRIEKSFPAGFRGVVYGAARGYRGGRLEVCVVSRRAGCPSGGFRVTGNSSFGSAVTPASEVRDTALTFDSIGSATRVEITAIAVR